MYSPPLFSLCSHPAVGARTSNQRHPTKPQAEAVRGTDIIPDSRQT